MYREQKVLIAKVITRKTLLGVSQIPYCTQSSFSACINECVSGSMGHRRLSYITEEASQIVANVGWLGKLRPTSIRENGYLLSVPTRHTEQRGFIIHIAMPFIFFSRWDLWSLAPSPNLRPRALSRGHKAGRLEKCDCGDARIHFCCSSLTVLHNILRVGWLFRLSSLRKL